VERNDGEEYESTIVVMFKVFFSLNFKTSCEFATVLQT
jgi:hypothetical protein